LAAGLAVDLVIISAPLNFIHYIGSSKDKGHIAP
jgi:hypothetical protein